MRSAATRSHSVMPPHRDTSACRQSTAPGNAPPGRTQLVAELMPLFPAGPHLGQHQRDGVPGECAVGLRRIGGHRVGRRGHGFDRGIVHDALPERAPAASWSAARAATAMMVRAGLAAPWVGSTLPSVMYRFGTAKLRQD